MAKYVLPRGMNSPEVWTCVIVNVKLGSDNKKVHTVYKCIATTLEIKMSLMKTEYSIRSKMMCKPVALLVYFKMVIYTALTERQCVFSLSSQSSFL